MLSQAARTTWHALAHTAMINCCVWKSLFSIRKGVVRAQQTTDEMYRLRIIRHIYNGVLTFHAFANNCRGVRSEATLTRFLASSNFLAVVNRVKSYLRCITLHI